MKNKSTLYGFFKGLSNDENQIEGIDLKTPENELILSQGAASENHIVLLYSDGSSISFGANNKGQLGIGSSSDVNEFNSVSSNEKFTSVACGEDFTLWISENGCLYVSGINNFNVPTTLNGIHATQCSAYKQAASVITEKKTVLFWSDFHDFNNFKEYSLINPAVAISCGINFVSVLLENQTLFQIRSDGSIEPVIVKTSPITTNDRFIQMSSCESYTVAIDFNSNLWLFGQVGKLKSYPNLPPICTNVIQVFTLPNSIVAILSNRRAMVLGENQDGQLGTGNKQATYEFQLVQLKYPVLSVIGNERMIIYIPRPLTKSFVKCDQSEFIPGYQKYLNNPEKLI
ncbi:alpha tubulin suppressor [Tritrichomonas musculus]|uniref:Alpha tubulin suppressor n=1 Tax=Tritrichomonas musculus TaxID=1915356 RepID=A0ABR2LA83_9EUKA